MKQWNIEITLKSETGGRVTYDCAIYDPTTFSMFSIADVVSDSLVDVCDVIYATISGRSHA